MCGWGHVMTKFILISFGFLGFAFYELSGGADFDGEALRLSRVETAPIVEGLPKVVVAEATAVAEPQVTEEERIEVTRASVNLVSEEKLEVTNAVAVKADEVETLVTQASLIIEPTEDDRVSAIILPSLIAAPEAVEATQEVETPQETLATLGADIRLVAGNRVNVRGGPSTDFEIVGRLTRGTEVEVLAENGEGWVEMRSVDGTTIGWMADFLLTEG
jgi:hypothetical protein